MRLLQLIVFSALFGLAACATLPVSDRNFQQIADENPVMDFYTDINGAFVYMGSERFLPNQRVVWIDATDTCREGRWFVEASELCFAYDGQSDSFCWEFARVELIPGALFAIQNDDVPGISYAFPGSVRQVSQSC